jgi:hypothetical protein
MINWAGMVPDTRGRPKGLPLFCGAQPNVGGHRPPYMLIVKRSALGQHGLRPSGFDLVVFRPVSL